MIKIEGYTHISQSVTTTQDRMDKIRSGTLKPLLTSSFKEQDKIGGYYPSDQVVIAARTGTGKTAKVIQDMTDYCNPLINPYYTNKCLILYDSWEMPDWRNILRMISREGKIPVKDLLDYKQRLMEERYQTLRAIADKFKGMPIYMSNRPLSVTKWEENKKHIQGLHPGLFIINIFDHTRLVLRETEGKEEELITNLMFAGMRLKNQFNMFNFFISQMNRNIETNQARNQMGTSTPVASDIFGSDAVFQCADIVIALHRPGLYKLEMFEDVPTGYDPSDPEKGDDLLIECVLKQRDGWTGNIFMKHNLAHNIITDYDFNTKSPLKTLGLDL